MRIKVAPISTNPNCKEFHFAIPITGYFIWDKAHGCTLSEADRHPTLEAIKEISGVDHFMLVHAHTLLISKAMVYDWDEIEPRIIQILHQHNSIFEVCNANPTS